MSWSHSLWRVNIKSSAATVNLAQVTAFGLLFLSGFVLLFLSVFGLLFLPSGYYTTRIVPASQHASPVAMSGGAPLPEVVPSSPRTQSTHANVRIRAGKTDRGTTGGHRQPDGCDVVCRRSAERQHHSQPEGHGLLPKGVPHPAPRIATDQLVLGLITQD